MTVWTSATQRLATGDSGGLFSRADRVRCGPFFRIASPAGELPFLDRRTTADGGDEWPDFDQAPDYRFFRFP
jgi:hypothetical protein